MDDPTPETIAAIATAVGDAGIGIVRVSGPQAVAVADQVFRSATGRRLADAPTFTVHYGWVLDPVGGQAVDEALATVMRAPKSYTREDVVELSGHGGVVSVRRILEAVVAAGARVAEPGEFTKRAFLNGRLDLAQAEAVLALIRATHEAAHAAMLQQLRGGLSAVIQAIRQQLLTVRAHLEVRLDFPGEDHAPWAEAQVQTVLADLLRQMEALAASAAQGQARAAGVMTVICGRPNVGKSSLLNAMLRRDRAIVTPIPGTTRDTIEELMIVQGMPLRLVDTAGLTNTHDPVEAAGVQRSHEALRAANVALWVLDGSAPWTPQDAAVAALLRGRPVVAALNKMDLPQRLSLETLQAALPSAPVVPVSARESQGIDGLERQLTAVVQRMHAGDTEGPWVTSARHLAALRQAGEALRRAQVAAADSASPELVAMEIQEALDQLGRITGETASEDLLATIFSQFCIGK